jgi:radical SAM protein with 4Fe4S-binding SPASM domain
MARHIFKQLLSYRNAPGAFGAFRRWRDAREPCASCDYHALCRGGCKVVSAHVTGDLAAPDPECPRVVDSGLRRVRLPVL